LERSGHKLDKRGGRAVEWSFENGLGAVTVRQEGDRAVFQAIAQPRGEGFYKAWLRGERGRALLGTLIPEGGALRLRRTMPVSQLRGQGAWPPVGAEVARADLFPQEGTPAGWQWVDCPGRLLHDPALSCPLRQVSRCLLRRGEGGFSLAFLWGEGLPFPIPPLFCLSAVRELAGRQYIVFCFSENGAPKLPHETDDLGDTTSEP